MERWLLAVILCMGSAAQAGEFALVVNPSLGITSLSKDDAARLFLGKSKLFPDGRTASAVNLPDGTELRDAVITALCNKNPNQYKAYWSQLIFTGKGTPPKELDPGEVKRYIAQNPNAIGYIDAKDIDNSVVPVLRVNY